MEVNFTEIVTRRNEMEVKATIEMVIQKNEMEVKFTENL